MRKHSYEELTPEQNYKVTRKLDMCQTCVNKGLITIREADYAFHEWVRESFSERVSFTICTNRDSFTKTKKGI